MTLLRRRNGTNSKVSLFFYASMGEFLFPILPHCLIGIDVYVKYI